MRFQIFTCFRTCFSALLYFTACQQCKEWRNLYWRWVAEWWDSAVLIVITLIGPHPKPGIRKEHGVISFCLFPHSCGLSSLRAEAREKRPRHNKSQWTLFAPNIHWTVWPNGVCVTWPEKISKHLRSSQCRNADGKPQTSILLSLSVSCSNILQLHSKLLVLIPIPFSVGTGQRKSYSCSHWAHAVALIWKIISEADWTINVIFVFIFFLSLPSPLPLLFYSPSLQLFHSQWGGFTRGLERALHVGDLARLSVPRVANGEKPI